MFDFFRRNKETSISVNILIKKENGEFVAHCLELDIVAVADTKANVQREVITLICAQVDYAFSNDNLDNLFHPAPTEVWSEFFACKEAQERRYKLESGFKKAAESHNTVLPPWLIANTCEGNLCHV